MVGEGFPLPAYLENIWAILRVLFRGDTSLTQVRLIPLRGASSFQPLLYLPVLHSVPIFCTASKSAKLAEDKQPNYLWLVTQNSCYGLNCVLPQLICGIPNPQCDYIW